MVVVERVETFQSLHRDFENKHSRTRYTSIIFSTRESETIPASTLQVGRGWIKFTKRSDFSGYLHAKYIVAVRASAGHTSRSGCSGLTLRAAHRCNVPGDISSKGETFSRSVRFLDERTQANRIRMTSTKTTGGKRRRRPPGDAQGFSPFISFSFPFPLFFFFSPLLSSFFCKGYFDFPPVHSTLTKPRRFLGRIHGLARRPAHPAKGTKIVNGGRETAKRA